MGPVLLEPWIAHPNVSAVLLAGLPGQESGNALVDVLFGAVSPSGRLPYTIAKARGDYPADVLYESGMETPQITYAEGVDIDYRCVPPALFPLFCPSAADRERARAGTSTWRASRRALSSGLGSATRHSRTTG